MFRTRKTNERKVKHLAKPTNGERCGEDYDPTNAAYGGRLSNATYILYPYEDKTLSRVCSNKSRDLQLTTGICLTNSHKDKAVLTKDTFGSGRPKTPLSIADAIPKFQNFVSNAYNHTVSIICYTKYKKGNLQRHVTSIHLYLPL